MTDVRRVYFDSTVYVAAIVGPGELYHGVSLSAIDHARSGGTTGVTSGLAHAEVLGAAKIRAPEGVGVEEVARRIMLAQEFFDRLGFEFVDLTRRVGRLAAEIGSHYHVKGPDAAHVAMAILARCNELQTLDQDQLKLGTIQGVHVRRPQSPLTSPGSLFAEDDEAGTTERQPRPSVKRKIREL